MPRRSLWDGKVTDSGVLAPLSSEPQAKQLSLYQLMPQLLLYTHLGPMHKMLRACLRESHCPAALDINGCQWPLLVLRDPVDYSQHRLLPRL